MITTSRPWIRQMPVMIRAQGASSSYRPLAARAQSSRKGVSLSRRAFILSLGRSLFLEIWSSLALGGPPALAASRRFLNSATTPLLTFSFSLNSGLSVFMLEIILSMRNNSLHPAGVFYQKPALLTNARYGPLRPAFAGLIRLAYLSHQGDILRDLSRETALEKKAESPCKRRDQLPQQFLFIRALPRYELHRSGQPRKPGREFQRVHVQTHAADREILAAAVHPGGGKYAAELLAAGEDVVRPLEDRKSTR